MQIFTCIEECPRCNNEAINTSKYFENGSCHMEIQFCPHCGLRRFIEFVDRMNPVRLLACYQYGLKVSRASNDLYVGMEHIHEACGAKVWMRKDGHLEFGSISSDMSNMEAADIIRRLMTDDCYDVTRSYLSRWSRAERRLEVLHGVVPENMLSRAPETGLLTGIEQQLEALAMMDEKQRSIH
jgi:hypothetical protein